MAVTEVPAGAVPLQTSQPSPSPNLDSDLRGSLQAGVWGGRPALQPQFPLGAGMGPLQPPGPSALVKKRRTKIDTSEPRINY